MNVTNKKAYIYIKNNGLKDPTIYSRVLGSYNQGKINIMGRVMGRTWSLLSETATYGANSISLSHNPVDMVWRLF